MTSIEIFESFQRQLGALSSHELDELIDRVREDGFAREAMAEFVQAAHSISAERTVQEALGG